LSPKLLSEDAMEEQSLYRTVPVREDQEQNREKTPKLKSGTSVENFEFEILTLR